MRHGSMSAPNLKDCDIEWQNFRNSFGKRKRFGFDKVNREEK